MNKKLESLEKKFDIATNLVDNLTSLVDEFDAPIVYEGEIVTKTTAVEVVEKDQHGFDFDNLKSDFQLIRSNVLKLVNSGQRILDTASLLDVSDLDSKQISALSELQSSIGNNLAMLLDCYKKIADIEVLRNKQASKMNEQANQAMINSGTVVNQNILFNGSTNELLDMIKANV